jgi:hypothetical protein
MRKVHRRASYLSNLLPIQGTGPERRAALDVVTSFDVEWLRGQSVGVYPLKATAPETMIHELERIFESGDGGQGQGVIRFQPISRMNAVMAVTKNPQYLQRATEWVQRLDRSDTSGTTLRIYRVKFGNAAKVAGILNDIFVSQRSGSSGESPFDSLARVREAPRAGSTALAAAARSAGAGAGPELKPVAVVVAAAARPRAARAGKAEEPTRLAAAARRLRLRSTPSPIGRRRAPSPSSAAPPRRAEAARVKVRSRISGSPQTRPTTRS